MLDNALKNFGIIFPNTVYGEIRMKSKRITAALLLTLMLAACGGNSEPAVSETALIKPVLMTPSNVPVKEKPAESRAPERIPIKREL